MHLRIHVGFPTQEPVRSLFPTSYIIDFFMVAMLLMLNSVSDVDIACGCVLYM